MSSYHTGQVCYEGCHKQYKMVSNYEINNDILFVYNLIDIESQFSF